MLEFFANVNIGENRLVHFIESRLRCGLMQRQLGADEMFWSRGMFALLDLDPEKDKPSLSLLQSLQHPEDRLTFAEINTSNESVKPMSRQYRVIRRDGTMRVLSQYLEFLFDSNGKPDSCVGLLCDVTDQADMDEKQKVMERRFAVITRDSGLILNLLRPDGYVTGMVGGSPAHEAELNRRLGYLWHELIHPDDSAETFLEFSRAVAERVTVAREHRIRQPDGAYRWRRSIWSPLFDSQNNLKEFVSISQDIEKEKTIPTAEQVRRSITGAQVRSGRALVRWSVQQLSEVACISPSVVRRVEDFDGVTEGVVDALSAIRDSLVKAKVEFLFPPTGNPGVRLA